MIRLLFTVSVLLFSTIVFAQEDSLLIRQIANEVLINGRAYNNLRTLTKTVGPRLSGTPQTYKAEEWGQQALQDAGADKVYLQECKIPHWVRGGKAEAKFIINNKKTSLNVLALGNSVGTTQKGITATAILINSFEELEQKKISSARVHVDVDPLSLL